jgi:lipopolysaccharide export system permease protein
LFADHKPRSVANRASEEKAVGLIDRLVLRETLKTLVVIVVVLVLLMLGSLLVRYLDKAASGLFGTEVLLWVVGLELVKAIGLIIPPAFFFAVLWVLGRMYRDSEMVALQASGFGYARLYRSVLIAVVPLFVLVAWLVMSVLPWAKGSVAQIRAEQANKADIGGVRVGRFNEFSRGGLVVYAEGSAAQGQGLQGVFLQDRQQGQIGLVTAQSAYQASDPETGERFIVLTDGRRYEGLPGQRDYALASFDEYAVRIPSFELTDYVPRRSAQPWTALVGSEDPKDWAELQYRLSVPLALVAFAILAVPLSRSPPRSGVYGRLTLAVLLYFTFMNLQRIAEKLLEDELIPAWLGMWWLPLLMAAVAAMIQMLDSNWFMVQRRRWRMRRP